MAKQTQLSPEVGQRTVRLVWEHRDAYEMHWVLRLWVRRPERMPGSGHAWPRTNSSASR